MTFPFWARHQRARVAPPPPPVGSFSASISNGAWTIQQGGSGQRVITIVRTSYTETITPVAAGLPSGVTASFSPTTSTGSNTSLTVTLTATIGAGLVTADPFTVTLSGAGVDPVALNGTVTVTAPISGQLPAGHFEPAKMPMALVYPRPDGETYVHARHRKAYPGIANRIPVVVQGGAYPFIYSIQAGPSGATIGATYADSDYGVWSWTPSADGTAQTVTVRVTDQEGAFVDATWTITADAASFVFLDPATPTSGSGTISSPYKTWPDVFGTTTTDTSNTERVLVLRGGTHTVVGYSSATPAGNLPMLAYNKPMGWIGYPGETPTVVCSTAAINFTGSNDGLDFFTSGVRYLTTRLDLPNTRFFFVGALAASRSTWFECVFEDLTRGTVGTDNPGAIVMFDNNNAVGRRQYVAIINCAHLDFDSPLCDLYDTFYGVVEGNTLGVSKDGQVNQGIYLKQNNGFFSVRRNASTQAMFDEGIIMHSFNGTNAGASQQVEFCYNLCALPTLGTNAAGARIDWSSAAFAGSQAWWYRNTIVGRTRALASTNRQVFIDRNVVINDDASPANSDGLADATVTENLTASFANLGTLINPATYLLTGTARTNHVGRRGHEISAGA
jgi:hypothetical protein